MKRGLAKGFIVAAAYSANCHAACAERLTHEIHQLYERDQRARLELFTHEHSPGARKRLQKSLALIDARSTAFSKSVISECGWPKQSEIGADAAEEFSNWSSMRIEIRHFNGKRLYNFGNG